MTQEHGFDYAGAAGPLKQAILQRLAGGAHARPAAGMLTPAPRVQLPQHGGVQMPPHAAAGIGALTMADLVELAKGDAAIFGLDSGRVGIPAGTTVTLSTAPQRDCVPIRIIVSDAVSEAFAISNIAVGVDPVMITPGTNCSLAAFTAGSFAPDFRAARLRAPIAFSVTVTNLSGGPARFLASVFAMYFPTQ